MKFIIAFAATANLVLALSAAILTIQLTWRTEKLLDRTSKFFLVSALVLLVATLTEINKYFGILSISLTTLVFNVSRMLALIFFILGINTLLKICRKGEG